MKLLDTVLLVGLGIAGISLLSNTIQQYPTTTGAPAAPAKNAPAPVTKGVSGANSPAKLGYKGTGNKVAMNKGTNHRNGQRFNVNHTFKNYVMMGHFKIGKGQEAINHKTDGPNHGSCTSLPKCFVAGNKVVTSKGMVPIEQIKEGDLVYTHEGVFKPVTETMKRWYEGDVYEIQSYGSNYKTIATEEHPFFTKRGWIRAKDIDKKDDLLLPKPVFASKDIDTISISYTEPIVMRYGRRYQNNNIRDFSVGFEQKKQLDLQINSELLTLIGYYLAEGLAVKNKSGTQYGEVYFTLGISDEEHKYALEIMDAAQKIGLKPTMYKTRFGKLGYVVRFSSNILSKWFVGEFGTGAKNKKIPEWVLVLPNEKLQILLEKYTNGDGHRRKSKGPTYQPANLASSISENLIYSMMLIALKLGYKTIVRQEKRNGFGNIQGRTVKLNDMFELSYTKQGIRGKTKIHLDDKYQHQLIKKIEKKHYSGLVYNLEVKDDHSYMVHNHITHNCVWVEPNLNISSGKLDMTSEWPHPKNHNGMPCPSCKSIGAISAGSWLGWAVAAWQEGPYRKIEAWADKSGTGASWTKLASEVDKGQITNPTLAKRALFLTGKGLESEVRMHGATSGDTDVRDCNVFEITPPASATAAFAFLNLLEAPVPRRYNN